MYKYYVEFLTHTVQMKHVSVLSGTHDSTMFLTHTVQMKLVKIPKSFLTSGVFLTHTVQMKLSSEFMSTIGHQTSS